jgi:hypothetical protein
MEWSQYFHVSADQQSLPGTEKNRNNFKKLRPGELSTRFGISANEVFKI